MSSAISKNFNDYRDELAFLLGLEDDEEESLSFDESKQEDPCHEYVFSSLFFISLIIFFLFSALYWYLIFKRYVLHYL